MDIIPLQTFRPLNPRRNKFAINSAAKDELTRTPVTRHLMAGQLLASLIFDNDDQTIVFRLGPHINRMLTPKRHNPVIRQIPGTIGQLSRNLRRAKHMDFVHERRNQRKFASPVLVKRYSAKPVGKFFSNEAGCQITGSEPVMLHDSPKEWDIVLNTFNMKRVQRLRHRVNRFFTRCRMSTELSNHRIIEERNFAPLINARIITYRRT